MRTTLTLDDEVLAYARARAQSERIPLGEAVSRLAREGIAAQGRPTSPPASTRSRFALLPARAETITSEHVRSLMDQEGF